MSNMTRSFAFTAAALLGVVANAAAAEIMVLGGNATGSLFYAQAQALAAVVTKHSNLKVDVLPQGGTVFFPMFMSGEVDVGIVNPLDGKFARDAVWPYENANGGKGYDIRTVMLGSPVPLSFITSDDSGINSIRDLKGKRVVVDYGAFASSSITARSALANAGMTLDDVRRVRYCLVLSSILRGQLRVERRVVL